jgi:hypothetical protein
MTRWRFLDRRGDAIVSVLRKNPWPAFVVEFLVIFAEQFRVALVPLGHFGFVRKPQATVSRIQNDGDAAGLLGPGF